MKKILNLALALAALTFTSCDLTRLSEDDVAPENYFTSADECKLWLDKCYDDLLVAPNSIVTWAADDYVMANPNDLVLGNRLVTDSYSGATAWGWGIVRRINMFFEYCDNCKDESAKEYYKGVAYFFRALAYYEKVKRFGDVPYYDFVVGSADNAALTKPRDPRGYVMLRVMDDLDKAIERLDEKHNVARVNKWTALALKSRAALWEGTWRVYHANDDFAPKNDPTEFQGQPVSLSSEYFLKLAADAAEQVIDNSGYTLYNGSGKDMNYRMLFATEDAREDEVMLAILYNYNTLKFGHAFQSKYYEQSIGFTRRFMNHYLMADGSRFTDKPNADRIWYLDEVKDRDPRLAQTVLCPGYIQLDQDKPTIDDLDHCYTGYKPIKYIYNQDCLSQGKANNDFPVFRLAEVMLNFAEAKAELGTLTQEDLDKSINKIRSRVGMPGLKVDTSIDPYMEECYPNYTRSASTQKALVLEVRRERTIELVLEGFRMFDMLRWGEGAKLVNGGASDAASTASPYYGIYLPGPGLYDMDGDGKVDFEVYDGTATTTGLKSISIASLSDRLVDPDDPYNAAPKKGWLTGFRDHIVTWDEGKDYLNPIPKKQITLTSGALVQNPGWDKE